MGMGRLDVGVNKPKGIIAPVALAACAVAVLVAPAGASAATTQCYFPQSFFCQKLEANAPIDSASASMVTQLRNQAQAVDPLGTFDCTRAVLLDPLKWTSQEKLFCNKLTYLAGINYDDYAPMLYTVGSDQSRVPVVLDNNDAALKATLAAGVPIPDEAQAAGGTDGQMIVYQPSTDTMWEFWRAKKDVNGNWHASWGGVIPNVSQNPGYYEDIVNASGGYAEKHQWGGPSSSIPNLPGLITTDQLRSGTIGHALVFATWANAQNQWVFPAQRTDGRCQTGLDAKSYCSSIPQGARFRLDPSFDVGTIKNPVTRMIATAVQDYGMVLNNTTGSGLSFYAEGWRGHPELTDPYYGAGGLFTSDPKQLAPVQFMREFPWDRLQMLQRGTTCTDKTRQCEQPDGWPFAGSGTSGGPGPTRAAVRLRLAKPKIAGGKLTVSGRVRPKIAGTVAVSCRCAGLTRDRKASQQADVRKGRFRAAFKLAAGDHTGRYAVTASYAGDASHTKARAKRAFRVG